MGAKKMISVSAFTGGKNVPSARYRVRQLRNAFAERNISVREHVALLGSYPPAKKSLRPAWAALSCAQRLPAIGMSYTTSISLLQREIISTRVTLEPLLHKPLVFDVDDAIYLNGDGEAAKRIARLSSLVVCGNAHLAEHFRQWNKNVEVIPTSIDLSLYAPAKTHTENKTIGWIGTSGNFKYLYPLADTLLKILDTFPEASLKIISDRRPQFQHKLDDRVEFVRWSEEKEMTELQSLYLGIMPLVDGDWERGKCSFKMLQYMASSKPVIVSPVGMNKDVLKLGNLGYSAQTPADWYAAISACLENPKLAQELGSAGREVVEEHFSHDQIADRYRACFERLL